MGLGLRPCHYADVLAGRSNVDWFEVVSENFMGEGGRPLHVLEQVRARHPIALHGVSLSLGSVDPLNEDYLKRLQKLVARFEPAIVSDHLCWTGVAGENLHDLLPLPYTRDVLEHLSARLGRVQDLLKRPLLIENVSSYLGYLHSEMSEWEFLSELTRRSGCGLLLDVNNVYVSAVNHGFNPIDYLNALPRNAVGQIHPAGHSTNFNERGEKYLIDTHDQPVCDEVWALYAHAIGRFGVVPTMVEWDAKIPAYEILEAEVDKARHILKEVAHEPIDAARRRAHSARAAGVDALDHH